MKPGATLSSRGVRITLGTRTPGGLRTAVVQPLPASADPLPAITPATKTTAPPPRMSRPRTVLVDGYRSIPACVLAPHRARGAEHAALRVERLHLHDRAAALDRLGCLE